MDNIEILKKYFPEKALPVVSYWLPKWRVHLVISKPRQTRHGDYTYKPINGLQRISVNGSLSKQAFLITFVHELAHLVVHKDYGLKAQPHGKEWKKMFAELMRELPLEDIYPDFILLPLLNYLKNPKASSDRDYQLSVALKKLDKNSEGKKHIGELACDDIFLYKGEKYKVIEKRIKLFLCLALSSQRTYLFPPTILVENCQ